MRSLWNTRIPKKTGIAVVNERFFISVFFFDITCIGAKRTVVLLESVWGILEPKSHEYFCLWNCYLQYSWSGYQKSTTSFGKKMNEHIWIHSHGQTLFHHNKHEIRLTIANCFLHTHKTQLLFIRIQNKVFSLSKTVGVACFQWPRARRELLFWSVDHWSRSSVSLSFPLLLTFQFLLTWKATPNIQASL